MSDPSPPAARSRPPARQTNAHVAPELSDRALNRAFLARQHLLAPAALTAADLIVHLVGLQAQAPQPPYLALWNRLTRFDPTTVSEGLAARQLVRVATLRGTIFLHTADDAHAVRPLIEPVYTRSLAPIARRHFPPGVADAVLAAAEEHLRAAPQTWESLGAALAPHFPAVPPRHLAFLVRNQRVLAQVPPRGLWRTSGPAAHTLLDDWAPAAAPPRLTLIDLARRYLAAYGPASVRDMQQWTGLTRLNAVFAALRPELVTFRSDHGTELFDLPNAPRPDPETPAPVRLLPEFDVALLSHADKRRLLADADRGRVFTINGIIRGTVLFDGHVFATWKWQDASDGATLTVQPFSTMVDADLEAISAEASRLLAFAGTPGGDHRVTIGSPSYPMS